VRLHGSPDNRDLRRFLEGVFLGMLGCIVLYTGFGLCLVHSPAERLTWRMDWLLQNHMAALIRPGDPDLRALEHQLARGPCSLE
jgi:hypothetical protein